MLAPAVQYCRAGTITSTGRTPPMATPAAPPRIIHAPAVHAQRDTLRRHLLVIEGGNKVLETGAAQSDMYVPYDNEKGDP